MIELPSDLAGSGFLHNLHVQNNFLETGHGSLVKNGPRECALFRIVR